VHLNNQTPPLASLALEACHAASQLCSSLPCQSPQTQTHKVMKQRDGGEMAISHDYSMCPRWTHYLRRNTQLVSPGGSLYPRLSEFRGNLDDDDARHRSYPPKYRCPHRGPNGFRVGSYSLNFCPDFLR